MGSCAASGLGLHWLPMYVPQKRALGLYTLTWTAACLLCMKGNRQTTHGKFCGVWSGSALFAYVPLKRTLGVYEHYFKTTACLLCMKGNRQATRVNFCFKCVCYVSLAHTCFPCTCIPDQHHWNQTKFNTVNSEIFARVYFRETSRMWSFAKIKPSWNGENTLSFADEGKSYQSRDFLTRQICLLAPIAKIKFSRQFPHLQCK